MFFSVLLFVEAKTISTHCFKGKRKLFEKARDLYSMFRMQPKFKMAQTTEKAQNCYRVQLTLKKMPFYKNTECSTKLKLFHCYLIALAQGGNNSTFLLYTLWYFQVLIPRLFRQLGEDIKTNKTADTHCKLLTLNKA